MQLNKDLKSIIKLIPSMVLSAMLVGVSVNLYVNACFGCDSISILEDGIHNTFNVSLGTAAFIYGFITLILGYILGRKYISLVSVVNTFLCGPFINAFGVLFENINANTMIIRIIMFIFAILTTALGCAILIYKGCGTSTLDAIVLGISDKTIFEYKLVRTLTDITLFIIGIILKGQFGIGSIIAALLTGTVINYLVKLLNKTKGTC